MTGPVAPGAARRLCLSRRRGQMCTRPAGHAGLLWSERDADDPRCPGSGEPGEPAPVLPDGYPGGRALCPVCWAFVDLAEGRLATHDTWRGDATREEADRRRDWFNAHGW